MPRTAVLQRAHLVIRARQAMQNAKCPQGQGAAALCSLQIQQSASSRSLTRARQSLDPAQPASSLTTVRMAVRHASTTILLKPRHSIVQMSSFLEVKYGSQQFFRLFENKNLHLCAGRTFFVPFRSRYNLSALAQLPLLLHFGLDLGFYNLRSRFFPIVASLAFYVLALFSFVWLGVSEPGFVPKISKSYEHEEEFMQIPLNTRITDHNPCSYSFTRQGHQLKVKYCKNCNIYRCPRADHCDLCGFCVEEFRHHSAWLGVCIGKRNYRLYYVLLLSFTLSLVCCMATSLEILYNELSRYVFSIPALIYSLLLLAYFLPACVFQSLLLFRNETEAQFWDGAWKTDSGNPFTPPCLEEYSSKLSLRGIIFKREENFLRESINSLGLVDIEVDELGRRSVSDERPLSECPIELLEPPLPPRLEKDLADLLDAIESQEQAPQSPPVQ